MFERLTSKFSGISSKVSRKGRIKRADIDEVMADIREALLDADVHIQVVDKFCDQVREQCLSAQLHQALNPAEQIVKLVHAELMAILGGDSFDFKYASEPPTVVLLAGLQGSGKTTTAAKLANWFAQQGRRPLLVAADLQRPAAVEQLRVLGAEAEVPVFSDSATPPEVAARGLDEAKRLGRDVLICDTAGRLSIDEELMAEISQVGQTLQPDYTFFVADAMSGQQAAIVALEFHQAVALDAVVLTKLDSDARGGAALSVSEVVGCPVAFISTGERLGDLEQFHPDRLAGRILGKGDILGLIEQAEQTYEQAEAEAAAERMIEGTYTLDDFLEQMRQLRKMGSLSALVSRMPGAAQMGEIDDAATEQRLASMEAIICSMTPVERFKPEIINLSRRQRIAKGSGTSTNDVSKLIKEFTNARKLMGSLGQQAKRKPGKKSKRKKGGGRVTPKGGQAAGAPKGAVKGIDLAKLEEELGVDFSQLEG